MSGAEKRSNKKKKQELKASLEGSLDRFIRQHVETRTEECEAREQDGDGEREKEQEDGHADAGDVVTPADAEKNGLGGAAGTRSDIKSASVTCNCGRHH